MADDMDEDADDIDKDTDDIYKDTDKMDKDEDNKSANEMEEGGIRAMNEDVDAGNSSIIHPLFFNILIFLGRT